MVRQKIKVNIFFLNKTAIDHFQIHNKTSILMQVKKKTSNNDYILLI